MSELINRINAEINWYLSLEKAEFLGVTAFLFCAAFLLCLIIWLLVKLIKSSQKPPLDITFKLEDAALESFRKKALSPSTFMFRTPDGVRSKSAG